MGATAAHGTKTGPPPPALALALALARVLPPPPALALALALARVLPPPPALALALARVLQHADTAVHSTARSSVNHALRAALGQVPRSVLGTHPAPGAFAPRWEARGQGGGTTGGGCPEPCVGARRGSQLTQGSRVTKGPQGSDVFN